MTDWKLPPEWSVPREWVGERCFVICSGESVKAQRKLIPLLKGRVIAVKHGVLLRPNADVLFLSGERCAEIARELIPVFTGQYIVVRGKSDPSLPERVKRVTRTKDHDQLCDFRRRRNPPNTSGAHLAGRDAGTSAIDLAYHFGATEIIVLGYDMTGGHFCKHPLQHPPESHFQRHMEVLPKFAEDAKAKGIRIVNCSPTSRVECFERQPLEAFL